MLILDLPSVYRILYNQFNQRREWQNDIRRVVMNEFVEGFHVLFFLIIFLRQIDWKQSEYYYMSTADKMEHLEYVCDYTTWKISHWTNLITY